MVVQAEQDRVKHLLTEALPMLCKSGLSYSSEVCIEALIGITLDKNDVFLVSIKETVKSETEDGQQEKSVDISVSKVAKDADEGTKSSSRRKQHRKRRRSKGSLRDSESENDLEDSEGQTDIKREKVDWKAGGFTDDFNSTSNDMSAPHDDANHITIEKDTSPDAIIVKEEPVDSDFSVSFGDISSGHGFDMSGYAHGTVDYTHSTHSTPHDLQKSISQNTSEQSTPGTSYGRLLPNASQKENEGHSKDSPGSMDKMHSKTRDTEIGTVEDKDETAADESKKEDPTEQFMAVATEGKLWMCVICSKLCNQRQNLKRHINGVHLKTQRFGCKFCGKEFIYQDSKIRHERRCSGNPNPNPRVPTTKKKPSSKSSGIFYGNQYTNRSMSLAISDVHSMVTKSIYGKNIESLANESSPAEEDEIVLSSSDTDMVESAENEPLRDGFPMLNPLGEPLKKIAQDIL